LSDDNPPSPSDDEEPADEGPIEPLEADQKQRRVYERKVRKIARQRKEGEEFWRKVLDSEIGRREVWNLLSDAHAFDTRFACGPNGFPQPEHTWFLAGGQDFGQRLYQKLLVIDLANVTTMHIEHDPRFVKPKPRDGG
jgi:hypothetical protein